MSYHNRQCAPSKPPPPPLPALLPPPPVLLLPLHWRSCPLRRPFSIQPRFQVIIACFLATLTMYVERVGFSIAFTTMASEVGAATHSQAAAECDALLRLLADPEIAPIKSYWDATCIWRSKHHPRRRASCFSGQRCRARCRLEWTKASRAQSCQHSSGAMQCRR